MRAILPASAWPSVCLGLWLLAASSPANTLTVTSNADSGAGSLRQAIADAASGDTIAFDAALNGSVITLTSGQLVISKNLSILGPGPGQLALNGNGASRVFHLANSVAGPRFTISISGLSITNGYTTLGGGGIGTDSDYNRPLTITLSNCVIRANRHTGSNYTAGGGMAFNRYSTATVVDCEVANNSAGGNGGGGAWINGECTLNRVTFVGNTTEGSGGGVLMRGNALTSILNCTFSGNSSTYSSWNDAVVGGGALFTQENGNVRIYNSTFTGNSATRCGGIRSQGTTTMVLHSVLSAGNTDTKGNPDLYGTFTGVTNCLLQVTNGVAIVGANNVFNQAPQLDVLANNGGLTRTHAILKGSPAIDKGYNPLALATDQRGVGYPRALGTPALVDIGAYEFLPPPSGTVITLR